MSITIEVSEEVEAAIRATPDGLENARLLLEAAFGDDQKDVVARVNAALNDPDPGMSPEEADAKLEERLPWLKTHSETKSAV
jgi:hypothetical protein